LVAAAPVALPGPATGMIAVVFYVGILHWDAVVAVARYYFC
jgi:hypothetical protein